MHNLPNKGSVQAALAACLVMGAGFVSAQAAKAAAPAAAPAAKAVAAGEANAQNANAASSDVAKEIVTREQNAADAEKARDLGRKYFFNKDYARAVDEFTKALNIWKGQQELLPNAVFVEDINAMRREIKEAYYCWARELYEEAIEDADKDKIDVAIEKCRKAQEMYPPCKYLMDAEIEKFLKRKRAIEFRENTALKKADEEFADRKNDLELQLQRGRAFYKIGRLDDARAKFEEVIAKDPYNTVAMDYLRRIYLKMIKVGQQRQKLKHSEFLDEAAWKPVAPVLVPGSTEGAEDGIAAPVEKVDVAKNLTQKLKSIKLSKLHFEDTPLDEAIKYLKRRSSELDEDKEGVNFVLLFSTNGGSKSGEGGESEDSDESGEGGEEKEEKSEEGGDEGEDGGSSAGSSAMPLITMYFGSDEEEGEGGGEEDKEKKAPQEISLLTAIDKICKGHDLKYRIDEYAVVIAGKDVPLADMVTVSYPIDKDALDALVGDSSDSQAIADAFDKNYGIKFNAEEGSQVVYDEQTHSLLVTHVPDVQEVVERDVIRQLNTRNPQIQLQVKFVEVSMNDLEELGFEYIVSRPTSYRFQDLPMMQLAGGNDNKYSTDDPLTLYSVDKNGIVTSSTTYYNSKNMLVAQGSVASNTSDAGVVVTSNKTTTYKKALSQDVVVPGTRVGNTRPVQEYSNITSVPAGSTFTVPGDGTWYAAILKNSTSKAHTFDANDRLVRNVYDDGMSYGLSSETKRQDQVFNWSHSNKNGYNFDISIHALDQADSTDILSSPRVTTLNGQSASIKMVTEKYYPESWGESEINDVNGMKMFVPSIPEFGDPKEEGIVLEVEPNIDDENTLITLTVNPVILEFVGWTDYSYPVIIDEETYQNTLRMPILAARTVSTTVTCYDKATLVLGGIIKDKVSEVHDQYPILGDIPIIGRLFQSRGKGVEKANLLIFLTATLVNPDGSLYRPEGSSDRGVPNF